MPIDIEVLWTALLSVFVAMNVMTTAPIYLSITDGMEDAERPALVRSAIILAGLLGLILAVAGGTLLDIIGVTIGDLRMAGGITLLGLGFHDLVLSRSDRKSRNLGAIGSVPLGVPLTVGPATMTTLMVISEGQGAPIALLALFPNLVLAWFVLRHAHRVVPILGRSGTKAFGKLMSLMLMAIGVSMIRFAIKSFI